MGLSDCTQCWDSPCVCGHEWEKYSLEYLLKFRKMLDSIIANKQNVKTIQSNMWKCSVEVSNYDDDWSFRNKKSGVPIYEGSTIDFVRQSPAKALKAFTDEYVVDGFREIFGDKVPGGYNHVIYVRSVMEEYISKISQGITENLNILGNWDVKITMTGPRVCIECGKEMFGSINICNECKDYYQEDSYTLQKVCVKCGCSFNDANNNLCLDCNGDDDATG